MLFAHGFGCDQTMCRYVWPCFAEDHRVVLFDHVGFGESNLSAWSPDRYASLEGYAEDVLEICRELDLTDVVFVGHSISRSVTALHRRCRLHRRLHTRGHRWAAAVPGQQLPRLVELDRSDDHGK
jgi:alpha/beta hydrolase fold